ncbi:Fe-S cluster assembly protein SufD [Anabaena sp. CCY 9910]|uniref:Fe-S cluster assembly protein SufD n=1 Tax=Anabaena sp. CCY 9910 TaxID=3103870 RepID=UPI0039E1F54B
MTMQVSPSAIANSDVVNLTASLLDRDSYLVSLLNQVTVPATEGWLRELRERATSWARHSVIPNTREEEWRFTDLSALRRVEFHRAAAHTDVETLHAKLGVETLHATSLLRGRGDKGLVFVNGVYTPELSNVANLPTGIVVGNLSALPITEQERVQKYLAQSEGALEVFTALNTAGISDVAVVLVAKNVIVETPIHLLFISVADETATISQPRCLVVAESGSQVSVVEEFVTPNADEGVYLTNAVTEITIADNAQVVHTRVENESKQAFHIGKTAVTQARYSRYTCHAVTLGGKISRHNLEILQTGEQTETTLNGLTMIASNQLADTHSAIALNHPYGTSKQLHKCIVGDRAHAVFNGKVFVPKPAQLTDAAQLNRNLLLSSKARVDTKPQLEITADNVKCAHGATVSQLEDDEIFYLQSRGIDANDARKLLVNAFAAEIINQIPVPSLRDKLLTTVTSFKSLTND